MGRNGWSRWLDWALTGAWMGVIFYFSQQARPAVPGAEIDLIRKSMHVAEYALLFCLWCRTLSGWKRLVPEATARWALLLTIGYAASDEIHQFFVGREGTLRDVLIDAIAPLIVWITLAVQQRRTGSGRRHRPSGP